MKFSHPDFPESFISRIQSQLGSGSELFFESLQNESPVSVRINPEKKITLGDSIIPWCSTGFYLDKRPSFTLDPLFHAGCYYVQEASSMFLEQVFLQLGLSEKKLLILDACAAPAGKSTHVASLMSEESLLVSNEVIASRIPVLKENIIKWGNANVLITNNDPSAFSSLENLFDVILVDAPCSGEGLFRKDKNAVEEWSDSNCELCSLRQQRILTSLLPALKQGGYLIYCTCTYNPKENEENIKWMTENFEIECVELSLKDEWGIKTVREDKALGYSFLSHQAKGEGFFISVLQKKQGDDSFQKMKSKTTHFSQLNKKFEQLNSWIGNNTSYSLVHKNEIIVALHKEWIDTIKFLGLHLHLIHSGTCIAEMKRDKAIPSHEFAMSTLLNKNCFPQHELDHEHALKYLRKEDFKIDLPEKGFVLITHQQHPLGWINHLGNRFNNYYPSSWKIRMK